MWMMAQVSAPANRHVCFGQINVDTARFSFSIFARSFSNPHFFLISALLASEI